MPDDTRGRTIDCEVRIESTPERVWKALSEADELVRWFSLDARVEPGEGGSIWASWGESCSGEQRIEVWEPQRHLRTVQELPGSGGEVEALRLVIDFRLDSVEGDSERGDTVLRLVLSGFGNSDAWDMEYESLSRDWAWFLLQLKHYLERHFGTPRRAFRANAVASLDPRAAWKRLMGPVGVLAVATPIEELAPGAPYEIETACGDLLRGKVLRWTPPYHFGATVENFGDALVLAEIEPGRESVMPSLLLSTWGVDSELVDSLEDRWKTLVTGRFPERAETSDADEAEDELPRRRRKWVLVAAVLAAVLVSVAITYLPLHSWEDESIVWTRDGGGEMVREGAEDFALRLRLASSEGRSELQLVSRPRDRGIAQSKFGCKRVWLLNVSGGRLCREIAVALQEQMSELPYVQEIAYFPRSHLPLHEATLPDVLITLEVVASRERIYPGWHQLHHELEIGLGRRPLGYESDPASFRTAQHAQVIVTLDYRSAGLVSAGARHELAVEAAVERLDLPQVFADWQREFGTIAGSPEELIEEERPLPELPLPTLPGLRKIYTGGQFLVHNETLWLAPVGEGYQDRLRAIEQTFLANGWNLVDSLPWRVALEKGRLYFEAFHKFQALQDRAPKDYALGLLFQDRHSPAEARQVLASHIEAGASEEDVRLFLEHVYPSFRREFLAHLRQHPLPDAGRFADIVDRFR